MPQWSRDMSRQSVLQRRWLDRATESTEPHRPAVDPPRAADDATAATQQVDRVAWAVTRHRYAACLRPSNTRRLFDSCQSFHNNDALSFGRYFG